MFGENCSRQQLVTKKRVEKRCWRAVHYQDSWRFSIWNFGRWYSHRKGSQVKNGYKLQWKNWITTWFTAWFTLYVNAPRCLLLKSFREVDIAKFWNENYFESLPLHKIRYRRQDLLRRFFWQFTGWPIAYRFLSPVSWLMAITSNNFYTSISNWSFSIFMVCIQAHELPWSCLPK